MNQLNRLYVGNLDVTVDSTYLQELASKYGDVMDCIVLSDSNPGGQVRKYGFVAFAKPEQAEAMLRLNGEYCPVHGRKFVVREANQRQSRQH